MKSAECPHCQQPVSISAKFCEGCGLSLPTMTAQEKPQRRRYGLWIIFGALLIALLVGASVAYAHYQLAVTDMNQARQDVRQGQYSAAWTILQRAKTAWKWLDVATEESLVQELLASERAFTAGNTAWDAGQWRSAISDFSSVVPQDTHYASAQRSLTILHQAKADGQQISAVLTATNTLNTDLQRFWNDYNTTINYLNPAWQGYSTSYGTGYSTTAFTRDVQSAAPLITSLGNESTAVGNDVSALSAAIGLLQSTTALRNGSASQLLISSSDLSSQANIIATALYDEFGSLQSISTTGTNSGVGVGKDISTINTAFAALQSDQNAVQQESSAVVGYAVGAVVKLLGSPSHLNVLIPNLPASGS